MMSRWVLVAVVLTVYWLRDIRLVIRPLTGQSCLPDDEGTWSIGIYRGMSPLNFTPIEMWEGRYDAPEKAAWPVSNPVVTCATVKEPPANFVADPFLFAQTGYRSDPLDKTIERKNPIFMLIPNPLYLFFEVKNNVEGKGEVGVAQSRDGGATWDYLGIALKEAWHLSYPHVFEWNNEEYLLPEASKSGKLTLYKAKKFPLEWEPVAVLAEQPLVDPSIIEWQGVWYLFATDSTARSRRIGGSAAAIELHIFHAESPLGPWSSHFLNPVMVGGKGSGARMAGRLVKYKDKLYRFGQDCAGTYGRDVLAFRIDVLSPTEFVQKRVKFQAGRVRKAGLAWNRERRHHVDAIQLSDGSWLAAMDGDSTQSNVITNPLRRRVYVAIVLWVLSVVCVKKGLFALKNHHKKSDDAAMKHPSVATTIGVPLRMIMIPFVGGHVRLWDNYAKKIFRHKGTMDPTSKKDGKGRAPGHAIRDTALWLTASVIFIFMTIRVCLWSSRYVRYFNLTNVPLHRSMNFYPPFGVYSQYSVIIHLPVKLGISMTSRQKRNLLHAQVKHYSKCASVSEVIVHHLESDEFMEYVAKRYPKFRALRLHSNDRSLAFQGDPDLRTKAVMFLDAGVMIGCDDAEAMFDHWRIHPDQIVGIRPGMMKGFNTETPQLMDDAATHKHSSFNVMLSSATMFDWEVATSLYWSEEYEESRNIVYSRSACEDILLSLAWLNNRARTLHNSSEALLFHYPSRGAMSILPTSISSKNLFQVYNECIELFQEDFADVSTATFPVAKCQSIFGTSCSSFL